jgi:hypothetical protein
MGEGITMEVCKKPRAFLCSADPLVKEPKQSTPSIISIWRPWQRAWPRVVALRLDSSGSFGTATEYQDSEVLRSHFNQRRHLNTTSQRSVYILESLGSEFAAVLGSHFQLHPALFKDHERLVAFHKQDTRERRWHTISADCYSWPGLHHLQIPRAGATPHSPNWLQELVRHVRTAYRSHKGHGELL